MQPSIALAMIVKDDPEELALLRGCLENIRGHVDGIYIDFNGPEGYQMSEEALEIVGDYGVDWQTKEWTGNFVTARNDVFSRVQEDFVMWLDADDTMDKPEKIRDVVAILGKHQQGIYVKYNYDHDEYGNTTVSHYVARIVRNNGSYVWKSSIADEDMSVHETLVEVIPRPKAVCDDFVIEHHADTNRREDSLMRNIELLQGMYDKQLENHEFDPRTLFYLATHYYDLGDFRKAAGLLQDYLGMSGWPEERCEAHVYLGNIYQKFEDNEHAYEEYICGLGEYQNSPRPYIELSQLSYNIGRYQDSADWIEKCLQLPAPATTMVQRPMESTFRAHLLATQAYVNIGGKKLDKAQEHVTKALKLRPLDPDAQRARDMIEDMFNQREDIRAAMRIVRKFEGIDKSKIIPFIDSLPLEVQDNPLILNTRFNFTKPKKWPKKSIAIYVGQGPLGIWGPWSLEEGIGGSEEAVIRLSRELAKQNWSVTIYATPGERAGDEIVDMETDGVVSWKQYYEFNPKDEYDVLIAWRNPAFFDANFKARKKYLWLHDVMDKEEFLPERLDNLDKVIFVGQYHANLYKGVIPEYKRFVSANGINPSDFIAADGKYERTPHKMIYMSAYNRGLKILLDNWKEIKKAVPDATLDIYYGWGSYDAINKDNPERMEWKTKLVKQMNSLAGVTDHGKVGQNEIVKVIAEADIFAYPCIFNEVYAISYVKAMAGGAWPVSTDFAELEHYKDDGGEQVHFELGQLVEMMPRYVKKLIGTLNSGVTNEQREAMMKVAREKYSWEETASKWDGEMS